MNTLIYKIKEQKLRMTAANIFYTESFDLPSKITLPNMSIGFMTPNQRKLDLHHIQN